MYRKKLMRACLTGLMVVTVATANVAPVFAADTATNVQAVEEPSAGANVTVKFVDIDTNTQVGEDVVRAFNEGTNSYSSLAGLGIVPAGYHITQVGDWYAKDGMVLTVNVQKDVKASIMTPSEFVGAIMELCQNKRGEYVDIEYIDDTRRNVIYEVPLSEIVYDFFDKLKSSTKGYASLDYELIGYRTSKLQKMDILLNGDAVDALSTIVHKDFAYSRGKIICEKLKEIIADVLNVEVNDITEDTTFVDDLGADSLDIFQIIMGIEETFDIEIDNDDAEQISTVGDAVEQIKNATNNN